ncbi:radical S-adenosyl methionine domain-containing protein 1, mitochondrial-like isoform X4 [Tachypleus tridentatus]|uniref:radical S-adenosyl methionine domain-containing protein 1, mitochondrial-like isoform X4 n=1 Tax=Tachypleus tridentatus TaxID=6853 RepID=UPI003FD4901A
MLKVRLCSYYTPALRNNFKCLLKCMCSNVSKQWEETQCFSERSTIGWLEKAALYIHWPYCEKRCSYCNFNKYISNQVNHDRMCKCLVQETTTLVRLSGVKNIETIFFGGGTPSLAKPRTIESVISCVRDLVAVPHDTEVTLECNPTTLEAQRLREFKLAGINRVSVGVQALNDRDLLLLGRNHSVKEALRVIDEAKNIYSGSTSIDIIFGRPYQTQYAWQDELKKLLDICDDHVSLYQLTLERGTSLFKLVHCGKLSMPTDAEVADFYEVAVSMLTDAGFQRYEVSNFARNGAESIHNNSYWNGTQYIGIGPGAHGRFVPQQTASHSREARIQTLEPDVWMKEVERYGHGTRKIVVQSHLDMLEEYLLTGLRTARGINNEQWCIFSGGASLTDVLSHSVPLKEHMRNKLLQFDGRNLRTSAAGMMVADSLTLDLLPSLQQHFSK